jgi:mannose-6-phosphate isomerase
MPIESAPSSVFRLDGVVKNYDWGSTDLLPTLLSRGQDGRPWAEYWLGTHQRGTAVAQLPYGSVPLSEIVAEPLPFLLKFLGIAQPLSVQVHPDLQQAREGFASENALGVPIDASTRVFVDSGDKPEQICALTEVSALCGFRALEEIRELTVPLSNYLPTDFETPGDAFLALFDLDSTIQSQILKEIAHLNADGVAGDEWRWVFALHAQRPLDITVLAPLYLNLVQLQRHESLFLRAGLIHAYLSGLAVEVMGASDNVVRAGLTSKHIDQAELSNLVHKYATPPQILHGAKGPDGWTTWPSESDYFALSYLEIDDSYSAISGPAVLVCVDGHLELTHSLSSPVMVGPGQAAFIAEGESCEISGQGTAYACGVNPRTQRH